MQHDEQNKLWLLRQASAESNADCAGPTAPVIGDIEPPSALPPCAEPDELPDEAFLPANDPPEEPEDPRLLPGPLIVANRLVVVSCDADQVGAGDLPSFSEVTAGSITQEVFLDDIAILPLSELYRLAKRIPEIQETVVDAFVAAGDTTAIVAALVGVFNVSQVAAEAISEQLLKGQDTADNAANAFALARLDCVWPSDPIKVTCADNVDGYTAVTGAPATNLTTEEEELLALGRLATLPAGAYMSRLSKADANEKAIALLLVQLVCLVTNTAEATATCEDFTGGDYSTLRAAGLDGTPYWPLDVILSQAGPRTLRLTSTITAHDPRTAARTPEEAQERANALALAELDCFFPSAALEKTCVDINEAAEARMTTDGLTLEEVLNELATGSASVQRGPDNTGVLAGNAGIDDTIGVKITLPAGFFLGDTQDAANDLADNYALGFLDCKWRNIAVIYSCDDKDSNPDDLAQVDRHIDGGIYTSTFLLANKTPQTEVFPDVYAEPVNLYALPNLSRNYTARVAAGVFESSDGPEFANQQAALLAISSLECLYCNPFLPANCAPGALNYVREVRGIDYGHPDGFVLRDNGLDPVVPIDSITQEDVNYCSSNPPEVLTNSMFLAVIPESNLVDLGDDCEYGNDQIIASCNQVTMTANEANYPGVTQYVRSVELGKPDYSPQSYPDAAGVVVIVDKNTVVVSGDDPVVAKESANQTARALAVAQLDCFYVSPYTVRYCGETGPTDTYDEDLISKLHPTSVTTGTALEGMFISRESKDEVIALANMFADAQLSCLVGNIDTFAACNEVSIPPEVTGDTQAFSKRGETIDPDTGFPMATYFSDQSLPDRDGFAWVRAGTFIQGIEGSFSQTYAQVNLMAADLAKSEWFCFFLSVEKKFYCQGVGGPGVVKNDAVLALLAAGSVGEGIAPEGMFMSQRSQSEADGLAETFAKAQLLCSVGNEKHCAACNETTLNAAGLAVSDTIFAKRLTSWGSPYSNNSAPDFEGPACMEKDSLIASGITGVFAARDLVNASAESIIKSQLDCFYESAEKTFYCTESGPSEVSPGAAYLNRLHGSSSFITDAQGDVTKGAARAEQGLFQSRDSQAEADQLAVSFARGMLICVAGNALTRVRCGNVPAALIALNPGFGDTVSTPSPIFDPNVSSSDPTKIDYNGGNAVGTNFLELEADVFLADTVSAANRMAYELLHTQLICYWWNEETCAVCSEPPCLEGVLGDCAACAGETVNYRTAADFLDEYRFLSAHYYAQQLLSTYVSNDSEIGEDIAGMGTPSKEHPSTQEAWANIAAFYNAIGSLSAIALPHVTAPWPAYTGTSDSTELDAILNCRMDMANVPAANPQSSQKQQARLAIEKSSANFKPDVYNCRGQHPGGIYMTTVKEGVIISYESKEAAQAEAVALAYSQLVCIYCNEAIFAMMPCPPNSAPNHLVNWVPRCAFSAESFKDAQLAALAHVNSKVQCSEMISKGGRGTRSYQINYRTNNSSQMPGAAASEINCCKIGMNDFREAEEGDTVETARRGKYLYVIDEASTKPDKLEPRGITVDDGSDVPDLLDFELCAKEVYVYLEVTLDPATDEKTNTAGIKYWTKEQTGAPGSAVADIVLTSSTSVQPPITKNAQGDIIAVRRLIARIYRMSDDDSAGLIPYLGFDVNCFNLGIEQLVDKPQKLSFSFETGESLPVIVDVDSPAGGGGGGGSECYNLGLYVDTPSGSTDPHVYVRPGSVGTQQYGTSTDLGTVESMKGKQVYVSVTGSSTDNTYTVAIETKTTAPTGSTTQAYVLLGTVDNDGAVLTSACGPFNVNVCRLWYAATEPYFSFTISS